MRSVWQYLQWELAHLLVARHTTAKLKVDSFVDERPWDVWPRHLPLTYLILCKDRVGQFASLFAVNLAAQETLMLKIALRIALATIEHLGCVILDVFLIEVRKSDLSQSDKEVFVATTHRYIMLFRIHH
jgi:hypothetical protein